MYDIIIVGGGAVGLYLAKEFAKKGNSVLLLERKSKVGDKVCSGLVSPHIFDFVKRNDFIEKRFSQARIWIENVYFDFRGEAWLIDRQKFDEYLLGEARRLGAEIELEKEVVKVKEEKDKVEAILKSGEEICGRILAGCDGTVSKVAEEVGLPKQKKLLLGVIGYETKLKESKEEFPELFFSSILPGFFAWRIPRKKNIEWGIALTPEKKPKEKLEFFLKDKKVKYRGFRSALIPSFPLSKTTKRRVFLCGDAAGQIKPATGGGLVYGLFAAEIASRVIDPKRPNLKIYEERWREELQKEILLGNFLKKCYSLPNFIKKFALFLLKNKKNLDQDRPSTILR